LLRKPGKLSLEACIPLEPKSFDFTQLSLAKYSLYSGFVVLTHAAGVEYSFCEFCCDIVPVDHS